MSNVSRSTFPRPVKCLVHVKFGGKVSTRVVHVDRFPGDGAVTLQERARQKFLEQYGLLAGVVVGFELNVGGERGAA
jgi:hypothetical protein